MIKYLRGKKCVLCGAEFFTKSGSAKYCGSECRSAAEAEQRRDRAERKMRIAAEKAKKKTLSEVAMEAREHGMTYGKYVAAKNALQQFK